MSSLRVLVVTSEWPTPEHPTAKPFVVEQVESIRKLGVEIDLVPTLGRMDPRNYAAGRRAVARQLTRAHYDLVHVYGGQCVLSVPRTSVPMVVTFHGSDLLGVVGRSGRYTLKGFVVRRISRYAARRAVAVIVPAERLAKRLQPRVRYEVVRFGIDLDRFHPGSKEDARRAVGLPLDRRIVLFSGQPHVKVKRYELAAATVAALPADIGAELVTVTGQPHDVVRDWMVASDCVLITSRHEAGPLMAKEAAACNVPVVSVDVGDVREWLPAVTRSRVVERDEVPDIASALADILRSDEPCDGRAHVERFGIDAVAHRVADVYRRTFERSGASSKGVER